MTFVFDKSCKVEQNGNTITVVTDKKESHASVKIEGEKAETQRHFQAKDKGYEIKAGT